MMSSFASPPMSPCRTMAFIPFHAELIWVGAERPPAMPRQMYSAPPLAVSRTSTSDQPSPSQSPNGVGGPTAEAAWDAPGRTHTAATAGASAARSARLHVFAHHD